MGEEKGGETFELGGGGGGGGGWLSLRGEENLAWVRGRGDIPVPECLACFACLLIT